MNDINENRNRNTGSHKGTIKSKLDYDLREQASQPASLLEKGESLYLVAKAQRMLSSHLKWLYMFLFFE